MKTLFKIFELSKQLQAKKSVILLSIMLCNAFFIAPLSCFANPITAQKALSIAQKYITLPQKERTRAAQKKALSKPNAAYYVFTGEQNKGFVIVSGDDNMGEILAYSKENTLDTLHNNAGVKELLTAYKETYKAITQNGSLTTPASKNYFFPRTVKPLLKSLWDQVYPFNAYTNSFPCGCVATAMTQVMYYHKWPKQGRGRVQYTDYKNNVEYNTDFSKSIYDWDNMLDNYHNPLTLKKEQLEAVGRLTRDFGLAAKMQYSSSGSGADTDDAYQALINNFDYEATRVYQKEEWANLFNELMRNELLDGFPFYFTGTNKAKKDAHAWVVDGFDENGLFHMNFGWGGANNGYYSTTALSLSSSGAEFNNAPIEFNSAFMAVFAHPKKEGVKGLKANLKEDNPNVSFSVGGAMRRPENAEKKIKRTENYVLEMSALINKGKPFKGDIGVLVKDEHNNIVKIFPSQWHNIGGITQHLFGDNANGILSRDCLIPEKQTYSLPLQTLNNGIYTLLPVVAELKENGNWGEWIEMRRTPKMQIKIDNNNIETIEESFVDAGFRLNNTPILSDGTLGKKGDLLIKLTNLSGLPIDGYIKVELLNANGEVVAHKTSEKGFVFGAYTPTNVIFPFVFSNNIEPGRYKIKLSVIHFYNQNKVYNVAYSTYNKPDEIDVETTSKPSFFTEFTPLAINGNGENISPNNINLSNNKEIRLGFLYKIREDESYQGNIRMILEDTQIGIRVPIGGFLRTKEWKGTTLNNAFSDFLPTNNIKVLNNRTYKLMLIGSKEGKEINLLEYQEKPTFFIFSGSKTTEEEYTAMGIENTSMSNLNSKISINNNQLLFLGNNLQTASIFTLNGTQVIHTILGGKSQTKLSLTTLNKGIYVVKWRDNNQTFMQKVIIK